MRKLLLAILVLALIICAVGCEPKEPDQTQPTPPPSAAPDPTPTPEMEEDYTLDICLGQEWYTIDPTFINDEDTAAYSLHLFEGLMKYTPEEDGEGQVVDAAVTYGMAESYTISEDGLTYTFTIRENAYWSDGEPVRAQDFVYAWQRLLSPKADEQLEHALAGHLLDGIVKNAVAVENGQTDPSQLGVRAVDDRTLEVRLEQPCTYFPKLCASHCLVPLRQDVIEAYGGNWTDENKIVTNGAYIITDWVHDDYLQMEQNPYYYDRENLGPAAIVWHFSDGEQITFQEFESGAYDFIGTFPEDETAALKEAGECATEQKAGTYYLYFNTDVIADWRVRAAMLLAVDRESIVASLGGDEFPATGFVAAGIRDSNGDDFSAGVSETYGTMFNWLQGWYPEHDLSTYEGRCALAKALYQESLDAGSWYRAYEVTYCYNSTTTNRTVAQICRQNWMDVLGLTVNLSVVDRDHYTTVLEEGSFGIAYLSWMSDYDDAGNFLELMDSESDYNYGKWYNTAYDGLIDQISTTLAPLERDELQYYAENQLFSMGGFPLCPIFFYGDSYCISEELTNVGYSPFSYYSFQYAELK